MKNIKKLDCNPIVLNEKELERLIKHSKDIGQCIADAWVLPALKNAYAQGYNNAIDEMLKDE